MLLSIFVIIFLWKYAIQYAKNGIKWVWTSAVKLVGKTVGETMKKDLMWHINVLIVGYAGEGERGGYLTDTIMLASFDPTLGVVTFLSVPRDTYVDYNAWWKGKINGVYWSEYLNNGRDDDAAAKALAKTVSDITDVPIDYYMMVDFDGFVAFIDSLWGIDVEVKETIHDPYYPWKGNSYQLFHIDIGIQHIDGADALKYARSRKTTSDFSRALRQQQVIEWIFHQIMKSVWLANVHKLQDLYTQFQDLVDTNISIKQMLGLASSADDLEHFFSYVYTADCDLRYLDLTYPWCVMRFGLPDNFWWASVLIPEGASHDNLSYYKKTQDFAFRVIYHQEMLMENAPITLLNGIDKDAAKAKGYNVNGAAGALSLELKKRAFNVVDLGNTDEFFDETVVYIPSDDAYPETIDALKSFVDLQYVWVDSSWQYGATGVSLILGNDYLSKL